MFNLRKVVSFVVSAAMGIMLFTGAYVKPVSAAGAYDEAIETLKALKIMVGDAGTGDFRPDDSIRRSEFAKIAVLGLGLGDVANASGPTRFPDVQADHWAVGFINVATDQGLVIGDDSGNYRPDDSITYAEAMTILVRMLGYEPAAQAKGGFPTGYLVEGSSNGLAKNLTVADGNAVRRAEVAQMTFNSLTTKIMKQTGFGSDISHVVVDETILENNLHTRKITGLLNATENTSLEGAGMLRRGEVQIGEEIFTANEQNAAALLGYQVTAYAQENDATGEFVLLLIRADENRNTVRSIDADNVEKLTASSVEYWMNKDSDTKTTKANIAANAKLIYNGKAADMAADLEIPVSGKIVLIDNDRDNMADVVSITAIDNLVVEDISLLSHTVTDKYGNQALVLDPDDSNINFSLRDASGQKMNLSDLKEWDIVSIARSKDEGVIDAVVIRNTVEGKVLEITNDKYKIGDKQYKIAANFTNTIELGDEGIFFLDAHGKIAAADLTAGISANYAYLVNADISNGINGRLEIEMFGKDGERKVVTAADKVRLDGVSGRTGEQVLESLKAGGSSVVQQLITYEINADGLVYELSRANDRTGALGNYRGEFALNLAATEAVYRSASGKIAGINVGENTIVFDIPEGKTLSEDFAARNKSMFVNDGKYDIKVYDLAEDLTAKVIIVTASDRSAAAQNEAAIVDKITITNNDNGVQVSKLYAFQGGEEITLLASENYSLNLKQGDVVQYTLNYKGEIDTVTVLFDSENLSDEHKSAVVNEMQTIYGKVARKFAASINVTVNDGAPENYKIDGAVVYSYDSTKSTGQVTVSSIADIQKYDPTSPRRVFIRLYEDTVKEIVIVK